MQITHSLPLLFTQINKELKLKTGDHEKLHKDTVNIKIKGNIFNENICFCAKTHFLRYKCFSASVSFFSLGFVFNSK